MTPQLIEMRAITKSYPGVVALSGVDFDIAKGEVRALLGKNGAGKSTLVKILAGVTAPDTGTIAIEGRPVHLRSPSDGIRAGIATVHQELSIVPELSVAENVSLGRWPLRRGAVDWGAMKHRSRAALKQLDFSIDPMKPAGHLSVAEQQLVEIARALDQGAKMLILDEPTSSLVSHEVEILIGVIQRLAASGVGIIYISHRMDEIRRVATSVTVMRDGAHVVTAPVAELTDGAIVEAMLGETVAEEESFRDGAAAGERRIVLSVRGLRAAPRLQDVCFDIHAGEVLGIAGVLGSGRTELLQALVGLRPVEGGEMTLQGSAYRPPDLRTAMAAGVFMTPEDRRKQGAVTMLGIDENLVMASWKTISSLGIIQKQAMVRTVGNSIAMLGIKLAWPGEALANLSGGNQQKVVIGKALNAGPKVLLLDEPTRGVDVGAKSQIYALMRNLVRQGLTVVFVSGELEEFANVCDRVVVLRNGRITQEITGEAIRTETLLDATIGAKG